MAGAPVGISFKSALTRGGFAENVHIHDIAMEGTPTIFRMTMNWYPQYSYVKIPPGLKDVPPYYKVMATQVLIEKGIERVRDVRIWNILEPAPEPCLMSMVIRPHRLNTSPWSIGACRHRQQDTSTT